MHIPRKSMLFREKKHAYCKEVVLQEGVENENRRNCFDCCRTGELWWRSRVSQIRSDAPALLHRRRRRNALRLSSNGGRVCEPSVLRRGGVCSVCAQ